MDEERAVTGVCIGCGHIFRQAMNDKGKAHNLGQTMQCHVK
jgi:hypothetical protein